MSLIIKKKIGIDISTQPVEPIKKEVITPAKEEIKTEKKDISVDQKKTATKTNDKK